MESYLSYSFIAGILILLASRWLRHGLDSWGGSAKGALPGAMGFVKKPDDFIWLRPIISVAMSVIVSVALLAGGLYVVLFGAYSAGDKNWAYGALGALLGYWVKPQPAR